MFVSNNWQQESITGKQSLSPHIRNERKLNNSACYLRTFMFVRLELFGCEGFVLTIKITIDNAQSAQR